MFSMQQKKEISEAIQKILRGTSHPELSKNEIEFHLHVDGADAWSWADIRNNGYFTKENPPKINQWNEDQDKRSNDA